MKTNNLHIILGSSYFFQKSYLFRYDDALENFNIVLQNDSSNYLSLKICAYIYEVKEKYLQFFN